MKQGFTISWDAKAAAAALRISLSDHLGMRMNSNKAMWQIVDWLRGNVPCVVDTRRDFVIIRYHGKAVAQGSYQIAPLTGRVVLNRASLREVEGMKGWCIVDILGLPDATTWFLSWDEMGILESGRWSGGSFASDRRLTRSHFADYAAYCNVESVAHNGSRNLIGKFVTYRPEDQHCEAQSGVVSKAHVVDAHRGFEVLFTDNRCVTGPAREFEISDPPYGVKLPE